VHEEGGHWRESGKIRALDFVQRVVRREVLEDSDDGFSRSWNETAGEEVVEFDEGGGEEEEEGEEGEDGEGKGGVGEAGGVEEGVGVFVEEVGAERVVWEEEDGEEEPGEGDVDGELEAGGVPLPAEEAGVDELEDQGVEGESGGEIGAGEGVERLGVEGVGGEGAGEEEVGEDGEELEKGQEGGEEGSGVDGGDAEGEVGREGEVGEEGEEDSCNFFPSQRRISARSRQAVWIVHGINATASSFRSVPHSAIKRVQWAIESGKVLTPVRRIASRSPFIPLYAVRSDCRRLILAEQR